ncbi:MAG: PDZ domain-containing protein [Acidobacteria bacterium]|nr:PDZ domain-containing protein [Acidobacteriota bacterium]
MTRHSHIRIILTVLTIAASAAAAQPYCKAEAKECEQKIRQILANKRYLGVTLGDTRWGTVIREVVPDSPAARAGLRADDRIIGINHHDCTGVSSKEVKQLLMPGGNPEQVEITIVVVRLGEVRRLQAKLGLMPAEKIDKIVQRHIETAHHEDNGSD